MYIGGSVNIPIIEPMKNDRYKVVQRTHNGNLRIPK